MLRVSLNEQDEAPFFGKSNCERFAVQEVYHPHGKAGLT